MDVDKDLAENFYKKDLVKIVYFEPRGLSNYDNEKFIKNTKFHIGKFAVIR